MFVSKTRHAILTRIALLKVEINSIFKKFQEVISSKLLQAELATF